MKPAQFDYVRPTDLDVALQALQAQDVMVRPLAGGQSLVPMLNLRLAPVDRLVDLGGIAELREVRHAAGAVVYGALLTHAAFEDGAVPDVSGGLMPHVAARFAFRSVRTRGTIGGALALADPSADWVTTIITLGARIHVAGPTGLRVVDAEDFIIGAYATALDEGELLTGIEIAARSPDERWGHAKVAGRVGEYAKSLAMALTDRRQRTARLVLGASDGAPLVLRRTAEAGLGGAPVVRLTEIAHEEINAAERGFSAAKLTMHTTIALRALNEALSK